MRQRARLGGLLAALATSLGCGVIETPVTLGLEEGSSMEVLYGPDFRQISWGIMELEGGVEALITTEIDLVDFLLQRPVMGLIEIERLLFGGIEFEVLGLPTGPVCVYPDPAVSSGGTVFIDLFDREPNNASVQFVMDLATRFALTNEALSDALPGGLGFVMAVDSETDLTLAEMLALFTGDTDGRISVTQEVDESMTLDFNGFPLILSVEGAITMTSVNEFPSHPLLDHCTDLLAL